MGQSLDASLGLMHAAGWVLVGSAGLAFFVASALMINAAWGRTVLPLGAPGSRRRNVPGEPFAEPIEFEYGEPGARQGQ